MVKKGCHDEAWMEKGRSVSGNIWGRMMRQNMSRKRQNDGRETEEQASVHRMHLSLNKISSRNQEYLFPLPLFKIRLSLPSRNGIKLDRGGLDFD